MLHLFPGDPSVHSILLVYSADVKVRPKLVAMPVVGVKGWPVFASDCETTGTTPQCLHPLLVLKCKDAVAVFSILL